MAECWSLGGYDGNLGWQCGAVRSEARHVVANGCDEHGPRRAHGHTADQMAECSSAVVMTDPAPGPARKSTIRRWAPGRRRAAMSASRYLPHGHVATRWSGARQRRFPTALAWEARKSTIRRWAPGRRPPSMSTARFDHTATLLQDGRVLVSGGQYDLFTINTSASAEIYDPALGTWSLTGSMTAERASAHRHVAVRRPGARQRGFCLLPITTR